MRFSFKLFGVNEVTVLYLYMSMDYISKHVEQSKTGMSYLPLKNSCVSFF